MAFEQEMMVAWAREEERLPRLAEPSLILLPVFCCISYSEDATQCIGNIPSVIPSGLVPHTPSPDPRHTVVLGGGGRFLMSEVPM